MKPLVEATDLLKHLLARSKAGSVDGEHISNGQREEQVTRAARIRAGSKGNNRIPHKGKSSLLNRIVSMPRHGPNNTNFRARGKSKHGLKPFWLARNDIVVHEYEDISIGLPRAQVAIGRQDKLLRSDGNAYILLKIAPGDELQHTGAHGVVANKNDFPIRERRFLQPLDKTTKNIDVATGGNNQRRLEGSIYPVVDTIPKGSAMRIGHVRRNSKAVKMLLNCKDARLGGVWPAI